MDVVRPVGRLEKCSTARHALGFYRAVIVTCRYQLKRSLQDSECIHILFLALARVIARHAALCCSIVGEGTENPLFTRLDYINLEDVVTIVQLEEPGALVEHLERLHDDTWSDMDRRPVWKVVVFRNPASDNRTFHHLEIAFAYHHAIADGLSGAAFHKSLLQALCDVTNTYVEGGDVPKTVDVPREISLIAPLENLVHLPLSWSFLASQVLREYGPSWLFRSPHAQWTGRVCETSENLPFKSRLRVLSIPVDRVEDLLKVTRSKTCTLTSFITGSLVVALAEQLPAAEGFVGVTPYSMRRISGTPLDSIANQTSAFETYYNKGILADIKPSSRTSIDSSSHIWNVARYFQSGMEAELAKCPKDSLIGLLPYVSNYRQMYSKKLAQPREVTFEVSNLGAFVPADGETQGRRGSDGWTIDNILFSQGAPVVGPAITVSCASVRGGALDLVFSWQEGVVDVSLIDGIVYTMEYYMSSRVW